MTMYGPHTAATASGRRCSWPLGRRDRGLGARRRVRRLVRPGRRHGRATAVDVGVGRAAARERCASDKQQQRDEGREVRAKDEAHHRNRDTPRNAERVRRSRLRHLDRGRVRDARRTDVRVERLDLSCSSSDRSPAGSTSLEVVEVVGVEIAQVVDGDVEPVACVVRDALRVCRPPRGRCPTTRARRRSPRHRAPRRAPRPRTCRWRSHRTRTSTRRSERSPQAPSESARSTAAPAGARRWIGSTGAPYASRRPLPGRCRTANGRSRLRGTGLRQVEVCSGRRPRACRCRCSLPQVSSS